MSKSVMAWIEQLDFDLSRGTNIEKVRKGHNRQMKKTEQKKLNFGRLGMLETYRTRWNRQDSTGKAFRIVSQQLQFEGCIVNHVQTWKCHDSDVSFLWQARKKLRKRNFWMFSFNKFGPQLQNLKVRFFLKPAAVTLKKNPWSVEALSGLAISGALHLGQRTSTDGAALGIALLTWGCTFNFPTSPCIWDLKYPLHLMFCDNVGMATVQNTLAFMGLPTCCRVNCCLHVACKLRTVAGCTHSAWTPESLQSQMKLIQSMTWVRRMQMKIPFQIQDPATVSMCLLQRDGSRSLCWAMRWLHTIQAYNIEGCWWQLVLFLHGERSKIGHTFSV